MEALQFFVKEKFRDEIHIFVKGGDLLVLKKYAIPHRLDAGIALSFPPIKRSPPSIVKHTSLHHLKVICSITQLFWVFTFCLNFLGN